MTETTRGQKVVPTALYWAGFMIFVLGATLAGNFTVRHFREATSFFEFIMGSLFVALLGVTIMLMGRRTSPQDGGGRDIDTRNAS